MLIVAIPKSASTALLATLGRLHGCYAVQTNFFELPVHDDYAALARFHFDQHELTRGIVDKLVEPDGISKNHIVPTPHNQALLAEHPKVILLREPTEVIKAYRRAVSAVDHDIEELARCFADCDAESEWLERAASTGLLQSLQKFYDGWQEHAGDKLIIRYDELIAEPQETVNRIEDYFGLQRSDEVKLVRARYTRSRVKNTVKRLLKRARLLEAAEQIYARVRRRS